MKHINMQYINVYINVRGRFLNVTIYKLVAMWRLLEEPASYIFCIEMKAAGCSEAFTSICQNIWPYIQNDFHCNFQCSETLKYYILKFCLLDISNLYSYDGDTIVFKKMLCSDQISLDRRVSIRIVMIMGLD